MTISYPDLRDTSRFPGFAAIPIEDLDTHKLTPGIDGCLLLEILAFETMPYLVIGCRSTDLHLVTLRFEGPDQGRALSQCPHLKVGNTIVIMQARKHQFGIEVYGIRVYEYRQLKIIPTSLDELLELSDEMRTWPLNFAAHQRCHWCRNEPDHITTCDGCGVIGYCNSGCKAGSWNINKHKEFCKVIKNQNFRSLMIEMGHE
ncbi:zinc finger MYND domain-containing protein [Aspergillus fijiensis CBS 313.89]|uniref:MYND-type domain-containing protein n=1 Tax=Aspergillus fijiensis CBS 313.89 TaxID=1448319 RepID=A0A8G1RNX0_9EURO|nr:uncharacterized protein BO72DRAFT_498192 [Aspergillus fijiensis CBS 313.89]RAK75265.1 hypothetical protein BO72DRAFT_498192 [Aspergillus fijiensis CBS 313.89]